MKCQTVPLAILFFLLATTNLLYAQTDGKNIAVMALQSVNTDHLTVKNVEDLLYSFLLEQKEYRIIDARTIPENSGTADFVCSGTLESNQREFTLTITIEKSSSSVTDVLQKSVSRSYESYNRILLESRSIIRELLSSDFSSNTNNTEPVAQHTDILPPDTPLSVDSIPKLPFKPLTNLACLSGTWKGDRGVEKVVILRTGRAIAVLENGSSMQLDLFIHNGQLFARQKGPSNSRYYSNIPEAIAVQVSKNADPVQWEMKLSEDETSLTGIKRDISVIHNGETIVSVEKITPTAVWKKER